MPPDCHSEISPLRGRGVHIAQVRETRRQFRRAKGRNPVRDDVLAGFAVAAFGCAVWSCAAPNEGRSARERRSGHIAKGIVIGSFLILLARLRSLRPVDRAASGCKVSRHHRAFNKQLRDPETMGRRPPPAGPRKEKGPQQDARNRRAGTLQRWLNER